MSIRDFAGRTTKALVVTAALVGVVGLTAAPQKAEAGISNGAAVGLGLGALALGTAVGSAAAANPYYYPNGYYYAPSYYYPPAPAYPYAPRSCWSPYYQQYVAC